MQSRIMYVENKSGGLDGAGRIGRVSFSKTGRTLYYGGRAFRKVGDGYKYNHVDTVSGEEYWISGPKRRGGDRLYGQPGVAIDEDVRVEYWTSIRGEPKKQHLTTT